MNVKTQAMLTGVIVMLCIVTCVLLLCGPLAASICAVCLVACNK